MRGWRWTAGMLAVLSACNDLPLETAVEVKQDDALDPVAMVTTASCDKYWTIAVSGTWDDSLRWSPAGEPALDDVVCLEAAGTYTITLSSGGQWLTGLHVGDGAAVTMTSAAPEWLVIDTLTVARTGRLNIEGCAEFNVWHAITVSGNLTLRPLSTCDGTQDFPDTWIDGLLELHGARIDMGYPALVNNGEILLVGESELDGRLLAMEGGLISGTGRLTVKGNLEWSGGSLPPRRSDGSAALSIEGGGIHFQSGTVSGAVDIVTDSAFIGWAQIDGNIGSGVDLGVAGTKKLYLVPTNIANPFRILGRVTSLRDDTTWIDFFGDAINTGTIAARQGVLMMTPSSLENRGTIEIDAVLKLSSSRLLNRGTIDVDAGGALVMRYSDFIANPAGSMTGRLELHTLSELSGNGSVGDVAVLGASSSVTPGTAASPIGKLSLASLSLNAQSTTILDVGGTDAGTFDRIQVTGPVNYAGALEVRTVAFFQGGRCGHDIGLIFASDSTALQKGHFTTYTGLQQTARAEWRAHYAPRGLRLVGFDPGVPLSFSPPSVLIDEGGAGTTVQACLGPDAPQRTVTFAQDASVGQVALQPVSIRFDSIDWMRPRSLALTAVDDALAEGPHRVTIGLTGSSADASYDGLTVSSLIADVIDNEPGVDLDLTLVSAPAAATPNQTVEARFRVANAGPGASSGSSFTFSPLAGLTYVGNSAGATCTTSGALVTCTVAALASAAQVEFTIVFRTQSTGSHANFGLVAGSEYDHDGTNNTVTWNLTVT